MINEINDLDTKVLGHPGRLKSFKLSPRTPRFCSAFGAHAKSTRLVLLSLLKLPNVWKRRKGRLETRNGRISESGQMG